MLFTEVMMLYLFPLATFLSFLALLGFLLDVVFRTQLVRLKKKDK